MRSIPSTATVPWTELNVDSELFRRPPREYGILPFWFLNGELDPEEMRWQLREFREKGIPGIILHGRYGLEMPYLGDTYLDRIKLAVDEAEKLGLKTWIYDEMNWPSGTADLRVVHKRPELAQRYLHCVEMGYHGPWFACMTGEDSRYADFERSTPVAAFAISVDGEIVDLTPNLSFEKVVPWQVPPGDWRLLYIVEKRADYYIDALDPESTAEFLRTGYEPYAQSVGEQFGTQVPGFYTDEPAMHYFLNASDNPIVPWTKDMFRRFRERNGYGLRSYLPHLFFDVGPDSARVRFDFYETLTEFYSDAYYRQISEWCADRGVIFTGHLLYEERLREMIRVEGNLFRHYEHLHVIGVDHLYPIIGERDNPAEHVAIKVASSAAHQFGSERLLCESFGGMFMDATMQRMKWIADWEYVLGVNLLNPHGFHYTLEGPRKRDWPPSMFYQYPWWRYYSEFSDYMSRLSYMLTGGRHVAKLAVLWPMTSLFANYTPQARNRFDERIESDFNVLTDMLLRLHHDFDYVDDEALAGAEIGDGVLRIGDEEHELVVLPPITHIKLAALEQLERFVAAGGRAIGLVFLPDQAFGPEGAVDVADRVRALFGIDPRESQRDFADQQTIELVELQHGGGGRTAFLRASALDRGVPRRRLDEIASRQRGLEPGQDEAPPDRGELNPSVGGMTIAVEPGEYFQSARHWLVGPDETRIEITGEVAAERAEVAEVVRDAIERLIDPDVVVGNDELFCLHRVKNERDLYFIVNPTADLQRAEVSVKGEVEPVVWDPSTGEQRPIAPSRAFGGRTSFHLVLPPVGSIFVLSSPVRPWRVVEAEGVEVVRYEDDRVHALGRGGEATIVVARDGRIERLSATASASGEPVVLDGAWEFVAEGGNALVIRDVLTTCEAEEAAVKAYAGVDVDESGWLPVVPGAWEYQQPAEPATAYPFPVWYRVRFEAHHVPSRLELILDGAAGSDRLVYANGVEVTAEPVRSAIDSQMQSLDISEYVREGTNVLALRLTLAQSTDGLLDLVKLIGDFGVSENGALVELPDTVSADDWTKQGFPYFSGSGVYRRRVELPDATPGRLILEIDAGDDVVEVVFNSRSAGVRLWAPYAVDLTELARAGENVLELRVANTPANLLEAQRRRSGLASAPRLVLHAEYEFVLPS
jgi:hypothetical protein